MTLGYHGRVMWWDSVMVDVTTWGEEMRQGDLY